MRKPQEIAVIIKDVSHRNGQTISEVLKKAECSKNTLYNLNRGHIPTQDTLQKIANILGVDVQYLLFSNDDSEDEQEIISTFRLLTADNKAALMKYAAFLRQECQ